MIWVFGVHFLCGIYTQHGSPEAYQRELNTDTVRCIHVRISKAQSISGFHCWEAVCRDTCGLSPGSFVVHQNSGECTLSVLISEESCLEETPS